MKPNLLLIMADQLGARFLPAYGHPVVKTPNIDRLAAEGVVFQNSYSNSPLCVPARAVALTGLLPSRTGVYDNAAELGRPDTDLRALPAPSGLPHRAFGQDARHRARPASWFRGAAYHRHLSSGFRLDPGLADAATSGSTGGTTT